MSLSRGAQDNPRDLERRTQPHRWPPIPTAAGHVELGAAVLVAPSEQAALLDLDDVVPRPDLPAVRVPRQLQVDAVICGTADLTRLVCEQHERAARISAAHRARQILAVTGPAVSAVIVDAGEVERCAGLADRDELVTEVADAEPADLGDPRVGAGVVLVVAGDREHAVLRA